MRSIGGETDRKNRPRWAHGRARCGARSASKTAINVLVGGRISDLQHGLVERRVARILVHPVRAEVPIQKARKPGIVALTTTRAHRIGRHVTARHDDRTGSPTDVKVIVQKLHVSTFALRLGHVRRLARNERAALQTSEVSEAHIRKQEGDQTDQKIDDGTSGNW